MALPNYEKKVNKSGDTLTGGLTFNNPSEYEAITKKRDGTNTDYTMILGLGGTGVVRLERREGTAGSGQSLEVRDDGLYSGATGKKLAEQSNGWTNVSLTSYLRGTAWYVRIGNIVIVNFNEVNINQNITQHATVLATGLPKASTSGLSLLTNFDTGEYLRILITDAGNIQNHWSNANASNNVWYGTLIYVTNE